MKTNAWMMGVLAAALLAPAAAPADHGKRLERRGERMEKRGERREKRGQREERRGERVENRGERIESAKASGTQPAATPASASAPQ